jgi:hypothetical protein
MVLLLAGCTFMWIGGDNNNVNVDKTGTEVDTETVIENEEEDDNIKR